MNKNFIRPIIAPLLSILAVLIIIITGCANVKTLNSSHEFTSKASLMERFMNPPAEFRLALNGEMAQEYVDSGYAGTLLLSGNFPSNQKKGKVDPSWMTNPELFKKLSQQISSSKENGYDVWFYDEMGYPSASAGGRVTDGHPELESQMLRYRSFETSGDDLMVASEGKLILCAAFPVNDGIINLDKKIDLTEQTSQGVFNWKPPVGDWKLCMYEWVPTDAWKHHDQPRPMGNIMDRRAAARFIEITHEKLAEELGEQVSDIFLFFTDEPQFNNVEYWIGNKRKNVPPAVPWAKEIPDAFKEKYGYTITEALPALFDNAGDQTGQFRHDFYDVVSDLVAENYWGQIQDWCHENGTYSSGHMLLEESLLYGVMFSGSLVKNWERQDLPGVDLLFLPKYQTMNDGMIIGKEGFACKMAASIATFGNKPGVFTESYALANRVNPEEGYLQAAKGVAAWQFQQGITHMFTYSIQQVLNKEEYIEFADFAGRLAVLSRRGRPVSNVAVLIPEASVWAYYNPPNGGPASRYWECNPDVAEIDSIFNETCFSLSSNQVEFEMLTEKLLNEAEVKKGSMHLGDQSFNVLLLPESRMLSEASMKKVEAFAEGGGRIVFVSSLPYLSPKKGMDPEMQKRAKALLTNKNVIHFQGTDDMSMAVKWIISEIPQEFKWQGEDVVRMAHQREENRDIIMIANPSLTDASGQLNCSFKGKASIWNPEDGSVTDIGPVKSGSEIQVSIPGNSARFVVFE
jgi:hypothetical protein